VVVVVVEVRLLEGVSGGEDSLSCPDGNTLLHVPVMVNGTVEFLAEHGGLDGVEVCAS